MGDIYNDFWVPLPHTDSTVISPHCSLWYGKDDVSGCTLLAHALSCFIATWLILSQPMETSVSPASSFNPAPPVPQLCKGILGTWSNFHPLILLPLHAFCDSGFSAQDPVLTSYIVRTDSAEVLGPSPRHIPCAEYSSSLAFAAAEVVREHVHHSCTCLKTQPDRKSSILELQVTVNS